MTYIEEVTGKVSQKELSVIGRQLLLRGLQMEYGLSGIPDIAFGIFGKPYFPAYPEIHFNISHCGRAVACALSDRMIGIDVETIITFDCELAEYVCSPEEFQAVISSPDPAVAFTALWTRKESYCKMTGRGLENRKEIREILIANNSFFLTSICETAGYIQTICHPSQHSL